MIGRRGVFAALLGAPMIAKAAIESAQIEPAANSVGVADFPTTQGPREGYEVGRKIADLIERKNYQVNVLEGHKFSHCKSWSRSFLESQLIADHNRRLDISNKISEFLYHGKKVDVQKLYQLAKEVGVTPDFEI